MIRLRTPIVRNVHHNPTGLSVRDRELVFDVARSLHKSIHRGLLQRENAQGRYLSAVEAVNIMDTMINDLTAQVRGQRKHANHFKLERSALSDQEVEEFLAEIGVKPK